MPRNGRREKAARLLALCTIREVFGIRDSTIVTDIFGVNIMYFVLELNYPYCILMHSVWG